MASLSIKISTQKAIESLEARVKVAENAQKEYNAAKKAYEAATKKHKADTLKLILKNATPTEISRRWYGEGRYDVVFQVNEGFLMPEAPESPRHPEGMLSDATLTELKQVIRVLKMTDEPTVNANVMKKFAEYL